jgi:DNA-binding HxlR family transcriptional regulator
MKEPPSLVTPRCPIRTTLELLGGKWKLLIIYQLKGGALRLSELKKALPDISEKMLIQELKVLADSLLVARTNHGEVPPRVTYELTAHGEAALPLIAQLAAFGNHYMEAIGIQNQTPGQ